MQAEHRQGMGGTIILWQALRGGQIDVYPGIHRHDHRGNLEEPAIRWAEIRERARQIGYRHDRTARF